jgi:hypothetical protein
VCSHDKNAVWDYPAIPRSIDGDYASTTVELEFPLVFVSLGVSCNKLQGKCEDKLNNKNITLKQLNKDISLIISNTRPKVSPLERLH